MQLWTVPAQGCLLTMLSEAGVIKLLKMGPCTYLALLLLLLVILAVMIERSNTSH
jgi:hypothetical protein